MINTKNLWTENFKLTVHLSGLTLGALGLVSEAELSSVSMAAAVSAGEGEELSAPDTAESSHSLPFESVVPLLLNFLDELIKNKT